MIFISLHVSEWSRGRCCRERRVGWDIVKERMEQLVLADLEITNTVEPQFNEVAGDRPNLFVKWRVRYIEVLSHTFYCNFGQDIEIISFVLSRTSLNRGSLNRGSTIMRLQQRYLFLFCKP